MISTTKRSFAMAGLFLAVAQVSCGASSDDEASPEEAEAEPGVEQTSDELRSAVSCREHTEPAYRAGKRFDLPIIAVGGKPIAKPAGHAFLKMQAAARTAGVDVPLRSGFRTMGEQTHLYSCYKTGSCNGGHLAARPGYSRHQSGTAVDVSTSTWLARNAKKFDFVPTVAGEPWHYEYAGERDPGGPCSAPKSESRLTWVTPHDDSPQKNGLGLKVHASDSRIVKVEYHNGNYTLGRSTDAAHDFPFRYVSTMNGERTLTAVGLDSSGESVAEATIETTITF